MSETTVVRRSNSITTSVPGVDVALLIALHYAFICSSHQKRGMALHLTVLGGGYPYALCWLHAYPAICIDHLPTWSRVYLELPQHAVQAVHVYSTERCSLCTADITNTPPNNQARRIVETPGSSKPRVLRVPIVTRRPYQYTHPTL